MCEEGLKTAPDDSELNRRLALCLFKTRRFREAAGNPASRFTPRSNLTKPKPAEAGFLSFVCRGILLPGVLDVGLRRREPCDGDAEGGARHIVEADIVVEFD